MMEIQKVVMVVVQAVMEKVEDEERNVLLVKKYVMK